MNDEKHVLETVTRLNKEYSFMSVVTTPKKNKGPLEDYYITVKDCICMKGVETTATSRILKGYKPAFDATVIKLVEDAGGKIIGKTLQDEFGFGSFCTNVGLDYPIPKNPYDKNRASGGSSGGAAVATSLLAKEGIKHIAIAESTGGSIENPASFCGVIGFCPTYGTVSRNGLLSYSNSLDKIGVMANSLEDIQTILPIIQVQDPNDSTSYVKKNPVKPIKKIGVLKVPGVSKEVQDAVDAALSNLSIPVESVELPFTIKYGIPAYYIIATAEASTNLACLSGLRYGQEDVQKDEHFLDYFTRIRSKHFNTETKRRIVLGTFTRKAGYRDAYYIKAAKVRRKIIEEYQALFKTYDIIVSPTMPFIAPTFDEIEKLKPVDHYTADVLTVGPNMAGLPHMSYPIKKSPLPIGLMIIGNHYDDQTVLAAGALFK